MDSFFAAYLRDNVRLVTDGIEEFTENGIISKGGDNFDFDVVIFNTGFSLRHSLKPFDNRGINNQKLLDVKEPFAFKGTTSPGRLKKFTQFFTLIIIAENF